MALEFRGAATPLDEEGALDAADRLGVGVPELWAVLTVETSGFGFLPDRRPFILYERHIFSRETGGGFDASSPDISNPKSGGYGAGGVNQYERLGKAMVLDRRAALRSTSWGIGQVMGFNHRSAGYDDVEAMVAAMTGSEKEQLLAMVGEVLNNGLDHNLRGHDWAGFARGYNGPAYKKNDYDTKLSQAYKKFSAVILPDFRIRAAQACLTYLGFDPGPVDGFMGRRTHAALKEFQASHGLITAGDLDEETLSVLSGDVSNLPL
jgi:hypothetical protein